MRPTPTREELLEEFYQKRFAAGRTPYNPASTQLKRATTKNLVSQALLAGNATIAKASDVSGGGPVGSSGTLGKSASGALPKGLKPNAARGAQVARQLGFTGSIGGIGKRSGKSDHPSGNAIDLMTHGDTAMGWKLSNHYVANRDQLGVKYVIYMQQIASPASGWRFRPMADRGSATANHRDHPHISFN